MSYSNRKWVILTLADYTDDELDNIVQECIQSSTDSLRKNSDNTKCIVKYDGLKPRSLYGVTPIYNHSEILAILNEEDGEW